jgi:hypothetical protein
VGLPQSKYPLEFWLDASSRGRTPAGIATAVRRVPGGATLEVCLPKEPILYFVHATVEYAGREPRFQAQTRRTPTEVRERFEFQPPCALFVYKWVEDRYFDPAAGEPKQRNVLYVCATDDQIERAKAVVADLTAPAQARLRAPLLAAYRRSPAQKSARRTRPPRR